MPTYAFAYCSWRSIAAVVAVAVASAVTGIAATSGSSTLVDHRPRLRPHVQQSHCVLPRRCVLPTRWRLRCQRLRNVALRMARPSSGGAPPRDVGCGDKVLTTTFHKLGCLTANAECLGASGFTSTIALEMNSTSRSERQPGNRVGVTPSHHNLAQSDMELLRVLQEIAPSLEHHVLGIRH